MANPKRKKFSEALKKIPKDQFGDTDLLSSDLAEKVGNLEDRMKITIRLDSRIIEEAKKEAEKLGGAGYQKIINDRLLEIYGLEEADYLRRSDETVSKLMQEMKDMEARLERLEKKQA